MTSQDFTITGMNNEILSSHIGMLAMKKKSGLLITLCEECDQKLLLEKGRARGLRSKSEYSSAASVVIVAVILAALFGQTTALSCHCHKGSACDQTNGFCQNGCEQGWYGPGCQVGNLAFGKYAAESSTYNDTWGNHPSMAVDGRMPALGDGSSKSCSHTEPYNDQPLWWYVTLSDTKNFVITNVTLVNRQGITGDRLGFFYILYSNKTDTPPSLDKWKTCAYEGTTLEDIVTKTYTCQTLAIGRAVAILMIKNPALPRLSNVLSLCEVYVYGYEKTECAANRVGPGCLLQSYNSNKCTSTPKTTRGEYDSCSFLSCPDTRFLPPMCWISKPSLANSIISVRSKGDVIRVSAEPLVSTGNLAPTSILINLNSNGTIQTIKQLWKHGKSGNLDINITVTGNRTYYVWLTPVACLLDPSCPGGPADSCWRSSDCYLGLSSSMQEVLTGSSQEISGVMITFPTTYIEADDATAALTSTMSSTAQSESPATTLASGGSQMQHSTASVTTIGAFYLIFWFLNEICVSHPYRKV